MKRNLRVQAIKELTRITRKGGKILIYVWAFEQDGKKFTQQDVLIPWHLQFKYEDGDKISNLLGDKDKTAASNSDNTEETSPVKESNNKEKEEEKKEEPNQEAKQTADEGDFQVNEEKKTLVYKRYYHMFKHGELEELIKEIPELEIEESYYDHANWCVKLKKKI